MNGPRRHAGFTLIEVVLAIGLAALLMGLLAAGTRTYTNIVADRRTDVTNAQTARVLMRQIARDVEATFYAEPSDDSGGSLSAELPGGETGEAGEGGADAGLGGDAAGTGTSGFDSELETDATVDLTGSTVQQTPGIYGNVAELQIDMLGRMVKPHRYDQLVAAGADPLNNHLLSNPKVVTYYLRQVDAGELTGTPLEPVDNEGQLMLVRRVQNRAEAMFGVASGIGGNVQGGEQFLSDQVVAIQFDYHDGYDWLETWDSSTMGLPVAVKITMTLAAETDEGDEDLNAMSTDNVFETTVRLPAAKLPTEDDGTGI